MEQLARRARARLRGDGQSGDRLQFVDVADIADKDQAVSLLQHELRVDRGDHPVTAHHFRKIEAMQVAQAVGLDRLADQGRARIQPGFDVKHVRLALTVIFARAQHDGCGQYQDDKHTGDNRGTGQGEVQHAQMHPMARSLAGNHQARRSAERRQHAARQCHVGQRQQEAMGIDVRPPGSRPQKRGDNGCVRRHR